MGATSIRSWVHERHVPLRIRRWLLELEDPAAERAFRQYDDESGLRTIRFALGVGVLFTIVYGGIDQLVLDRGQLPAALIRSASALAFVLAGIAVTRSRLIRAHLQISVVLLLTVILVGLGTVLARAGDFPTEYLRTSASVTLLGAVGMLRLRRHAVFAITWVYVAVSLSLPGVLGSADALGSQLAPTAGIAAIAVLIAYALERLRRTDFLRQREVELERTRSEEILHNVLPASIADRLRSEQGTIADSAAEVSVLFSDIVGFTSVSETLPPEELVRLLDVLFTEFDGLCEKRGIEKIKTVGDAYMAVAGLPEPDPDHAASLAELALDMQRASTRLAAEWPRPIAMRIGIATGPVVAGVIGQRKFAYDLWGDTVNTASRMESHGLPNRIQVCSTTRDLLRDRYAFSDPQQVDVKGKGPMTTYFLLGPLP